MAIFNALGSGFDLKRSIGVLFMGGTKTDNMKLWKILEKRYSGSCYLFLKGREAIVAGLTALKIPEEAKIAVTGFTCHTVINSIRKAELSPVFIDLEKESLNFSAASLEKLLEKDKDIRAVIVQNTLGYPCDIAGIEKVCKQREIYLVEDLAHSIGATYLDGRECGTVGDIVTLSFSQSKVIDGVTGGALVIRNEKLKKNIDRRNFKLGEIETGKSLKLRFYPIITWKIRKGFLFRPIGSMLLMVCKSLKLLNSPLDDVGESKFNALPTWCARIIKCEFEDLQKKATSRRSKSVMYSQLLDEKVLGQRFVNSILFSSGLRFPIFVENRIRLLKHLKTKGIYIEDVWYDSPVAPKRFMKDSGYVKGTCPNAENVSERIVNLPTHTEMKPADILRVSDEINKWLKLQSEK